MQQVHVHESTPRRRRLASNVLARGGLHQRAVDIARSITDRDWRANALAGIATALYMAGEVGPARRVAAPACAAGTWLISAGPVHSSRLPRSRRSPSRWRRSRNRRPVLITLLPWAFTSAPGWEEAVMVVADGAEASLGRPSDSCRSPGRSYHVALSRAPIPLPTMATASSWPWPRHPRPHWSRPVPADGCSDALVHPGTTRYPQQDGDTGRLGRMAHIRWDRAYCGRPYGPLQLAEQLVPTNVPTELAVPAS